MSTQVIPGIATLSPDRYEYTLVPTMGSLHAGHGALIGHARNLGMPVLVSIFVNPKQFSPEEDFQSYPRDREADLAFCRSLGVDAVWFPSPDEIYPRGSEDVTSIHPRPSLSGILCDAYRPGHFRGVLTVVQRLLALSQPAVAVFGEKDYQQLLMVRAMAEDLSLVTRIDSVPTARGEDGLAYSSRNLYLADAERQAARLIPGTLREAADRIKAGQEVTAVLEELRDPSFEYLEARDPVTLAPKREPPLRLLVAARVGRARLIDNYPVA